MWNKNRYAGRPGYDVAQYNHEIDMWVGGWLAQMGEVIDKWCDGVIARNGQVLDKADREKEKLQRIIDQKQKAIDKANRELKAIESKAAQYNKQFLSCNKTQAENCDAMHAYTTAESELKRLPFNDPKRVELKKIMQKNQADYTKWKNARNNGLKAYENHMDQMGKVKAKQKEIENLRSEDGTVNFRSVDSKRKNRLKALEENEKIFENVSTINMKQNKKRIVDAFYDTKRIDYFSKAVVNAMNEALKGKVKGQELTETEIYELITLIFEKIVADVQTGYNILKVIVTNPDYCETVTVDGKAQTIIDMNNIDIEDLMRPLNSYLIGKVRDYTVMMMQKIKTGQNLFVSEYQIDDRGKIESLCENPDAYNYGRSSYNPRKNVSRYVDPNAKMKRQYMDNDETQEDWKNAYKLLTTYVDAMATLMQKLIAQKLSKKAYINSITKEEATEFLKDIINQAIAGKNVHLKNGYNLSDNAVNDRIMRMALGGSESSSANEMKFKGIVTGVIDYYVGYSYQLVLKQKQHDRSDDPWEVDRLEGYISRLEDQKKKLMNKVLTAKTKRKARPVIAKMIDELHQKTAMTSDYLAPDEMAEILVNRNRKHKKEQVATPYMEDKVDFLLWGKEIPDGSGKHNDFVTTRPLRNVGDYDA